MHFFSSLGIYLIWFVEEVGGVVDTATDPNIPWGPPACAFRWPAPAVFGRGLPLGFRRGFAHLHRSHECLGVAATAGRALAKMQRYERLVLS